MEIDTKIKQVLMDLSIETMPLVIFPSQCACTDNSVTMTYPVCWLASVSADQDTAVASSTPHSTSPSEQLNLPPGKNPTVSVTLTCNPYKYHETQSGQIISGNFKWSVYEMVMNCITIHAHHVHSVYKVLTALSQQINSWRNISVS